MKKIYMIKKQTIWIITLIFTILTIIEFVKYCLIDSNFYGLIYMLLNLLIIFLLVPIAYNYNRYYSAQRISKLIIIIVIGLLSSYILPSITFNLMSYVDSSEEFIRSIKFIKNILKGIIYFVLIGFTIFEFKLQKRIENNIKSKEKNNNTHKKISRKKIIVKKL